MHGAGSKVWSRRGRPGTINSWLTPFSCLLSRLLALAVVKSLSRILLVAIAALWLFCASESRLLAASQDDRFLAGLRGRRLYELAEKYCDDLLAADSLDEDRRANLTIELSRTLAQHALESTPDKAGPLWQRAVETAEKFVAERPRYPRRILVELQAALVLAAQGKAAREDATLGADAAATAPARDVLRRAVGKFENLHQQIEQELRETGRNDRAAGRLTSAQLQALQLNVSYELGQALIDQTLCYDAGSPDRLNSLGKAIDALTSVARQDVESPLVYAAALAQIDCWRLLGEYGSAEKQLAELGKKRLSEDLAQQLRAARVHLALARGQIDEALAEAGASGQAPSGAEADLARLEALLAAWQRAGERQNAAESSDWQQRAVEQAQSIGEKYGLRWSQRAESRLAAAMSTATGAQSADTLAFAAGSYYRGGQLDKALAAYDDAARRARDEKQADRAWQLALSAATIEKERGHFREALERYRRLAIDAPKQPKAAEAHLLAIFCAAQLAQSDTDAKLGEYESLLREHLDTWPQSPTVPQVWCWLGRLAEHRGQWQRAIELLAHVEPRDPQYAEAIAAIGRSYLGWLNQQHAAGGDTRRTTDDALAQLEKVAQSGDNPAARAATLTSARIWLAEMPGGAMPAERLLRGMLAHDAQLSDDDKQAAQLLLAPALAAQGKGGQADALREEIARQGPARSLALLELVAELRSRVAEGQARKYAELELSIATDLLARGAELNGETLRAVRRREALALAATGHRQEALEALQQLARDFPRDGQTHEDFAALLADGNEADARLAVTKWQEVASRSRPGSPRWFRSHYGLATAQLKLGDTAAAQSTIDEVAKRYPQFDDGPLRAKFEALRAASDK